MSNRSVVPGPFGLEVGNELGRVLPHPGPRIVPDHPVLGVLVRSARRLRGRLSRQLVRHGGQRTVTRVLGGIGLLLASLAPGAVLAPASAAAGDEEVRFTVAYLNEVDSFNPFLGIEAESFEMWGLMYDSLTGYTMEDMRPEPSLATEWETSEDGLTWTFTIRDDVTWSDGEQLTAGDVAYTFGRIVDGGPERSTWGAYLAGVDAVTAPDDTTVVIELKRPSAVLPLLPIPIIPEHVWSDISEDDVKSFGNEPTDGDPVVGSGPFRLVEGTAGGSTYRFEVNPDYWGGTPHLDEVVFRVFKSEDPAIQALIKGEVDFVEGISAVQVDALEGREGITAIIGDSPGFDEIAFNAGSVDTETGEPIGDPNPAVLDPDFRFALGYAIDRDLIVERAYQGAGAPALTIIPPAYGDFHWEPPEEDRFTFDLEKAAELLDEAGYTVGDDGLRTLPDGEPMEPLRLIARSESETSLDVMEFFEEWLTELDIPTDLRSMESGRLTQLILDGEFDAFEWGWYVEPDPDSMLSYLTCDQLGGWNDAWYCDEEYDRLYDQQHVEQDPEARAEQVRQMQEILYYDAPYLTTSYGGIGEAWRSDRFACMRPQPDPGGIYLIQYGVYNYVNMRPASEADECAGEEGVTQASSPGADEGVGTGVMVGAGVGVLAILVVGGIVMMRRRASVGDRE